MLTHIVTSTLFTRKIKSWNDLPLIFVKVSSLIAFNYAELAAYALKYCLEPAIKKQVKVEQGKPR